ncbi:MAG: TetR/AcrR family transcriptional regulator [Chloroflexi bacterium]|nr:TetR/AcrR family transcriptional regulator [Chloroflexota bacterium]
MTTASPPTPTRGREATCNAILDATSEIIAERGLDGFALADVARQAGVNRALIYHYFQNRDNLIAHTIDHIMSRYDTPETRLSDDAVARSARMYIEHPEIGRFIFQLMLSGRPLLRLGQRFIETLAHVEAMRRQQAPASVGDPVFGLVVLGLSQLSWSFSREELARVVGISVQEADDRFVEELRRVAEEGLQGPPAASE